MTAWQRWLLACVAATAVLLVAILAFALGGISTMFGAIGASAALVSLITGWFRWVARAPGAAELDSVDKAVSEESLRRSAKTLPDLISLQGMLEIGIEPRLRLVHDPAHRIETTQALDLVSAFIAAGKRLLIVGEPASGKTIAAYRLAAVVAADADLARVPMVVNLSAWGNQATFDEFLIDYLCSQGAGYGISNRKIAKAWVRRCQFALILDGLDETTALWRADLLTRLDDWLPVAMPVVLTCRTSEYDHLVSERHRGIALAMAVGLQPLDDEQLDRACLEIAKRGQVSWAQLVGQWSGERGQAARQALSSPLVLNLAVSSHLTGSQLLSEAKHGGDAIRTFVIDKYVDMAFEGDPELESWANWIASQLTQGQAGPLDVEPVDRTDFELGQLTPSRFPLRYAPFVVAGLWLPFLLPIVAILGWLYAGESADRASLIIASLTAWGFLGTLPLGASFVAALRNARPSRMRLRSTRKRNLGSTLVRTLGVGLVVLAAVAVPLSLLLFSLEPIEAFVLGVVLALPVASVYAIWPWLGRSRGRISSVFDGPWTQSRKDAWLVGFGLWVVFSVVMTVAILLVNELEFLIRLGSIGATSSEEFFQMLGLSVIVGFPVGVMGGLNSGGWFLVAQWMLRRRLQRVFGLEPEPLLILQRGMKSRGGMLPLFRAVGSGVRFIHNDVRDRVSARAPGYVTPLGVLSGISGTRTN